MATDVIQLTVDPSIQSATAAPMGSNPDVRFQDLLGMVTYLEPEECEKLGEAYAYAREKHQDQRRKSGEPFVLHPVEVAIILADLHMDVETLCAALLHDVVEDTDASKEDVAELFGAPVAELVDGVTKITKLKVGDLTDEQAQTYRKMLVAMNNDIRVVVIKLADRLHNMRTLSALREDRRIYKSHETLEIYAPIAHRLGISSIKWELEDLSFFYLEPAKFKLVSRMVSESRPQREAYLGSILQILHEETEKLGIDAQLMGRPKHLYSIYKKMANQKKGFSEIYDLIAVRVIVQTVKDCYSVLGAVHTLWNPMPGRFKDYIAMPKLNMYQSLHTTVIGPAGRPLEVQIRTEEMHRKSEYGVAAHWRYKEKGKADDFDRQIAWLREMVDWQDETKDSREFLKSLKVDLAPKEVFVFTPKGKAMSLRAGSTPVDFAYAIHTEVGNRCVGAKVNGAIVPLTYELQQGDRVEILTQKSATPSRDWLNFVKTPSARSKIRNFFSKATRSDDLAAGRDKLAREMRKHGFGISNASATRALKEVSETLGYRAPDDMFVCLGNGKESTQHVSNRLLKILEADTAEESSLPVSDLGMSTGKMPPMLTSVKRPRRKAKSSNGVMVEGLDDAAVRLSRCCNPVPGDDIIGFITRGRGVSVHRANCPNAKDLMSYPERIIPVSWAQAGEVLQDSAFNVEVIVEAVDRMNLLMDVAKVFSENGANVIGANTITHKDGINEMRFLFQISSPAAIDRILKGLLEVDNVFGARRVVPGAPSKKKRGKKA